LQQIQIPPERVNAVIKEAVRKNCHALDGAMSFKRYLCPTFYSRCLSFYESITADFMPTADNEASRTVTEKSDEEIEEIKPSISDQLNKGEVKFEFLAQKAREYNGTFSSLDIKGLTTITKNFDKENPNHRRRNAPF
jgi:hypothetical protein